MVVLSPIHQRNFLSLLLHVICHLFVRNLCNFNSLPLSANAFGDAMKTKFGIRCCVTAWELLSEFSRDFDFEGKSPIVFAAPRMKWRKKCFNYKTVLRFCN